MLLRLQGAGCLERRRSAVPPALRARVVGTIQKRHAVAGGSARGVHAARQRGARTPAKAGLLAIARESRRRIRLLPNPSFSLHPLGCAGLRPVASLIGCTVLAERRRVRLAPVQSFDQPQRERIRRLDLHDGLAEGKKRVERALGRVAVQHIAIRDPRVERDSQALEIAAGHGGEGGALAHDVHRRAQQRMTIDERVDLAGDLHALGAQGFGLLVGIGKRIGAACLLEGDDAIEIRLSGRVRATNATLVHDALVLLLQLDENAVVTRHVAVPPHAKLFLVQGLFDAAGDQIAIRRVEIQAGDTRAPVLVGNHPTLQGLEHRAMLRGVQPVFDFLALEGVGKRCHAGSFRFRRPCFSRWYVWPPRRSAQAAARKGNAAGPGARPAIAGGHGRVCGTP